MKMHSLNGHNLNGNDYKILFKHTNNEKAIELSLWDKFCDLFRSNKKQDVINLFYNLITPSKNENLNSELAVKLEQFEQLKNMADPVNRDLFKIRTQLQGTSQKKYTFSIDGTDIYKFVSENNWNSLSKITLGNSPLIESYSTVIKEYAENNLNEFKEVYPDTEIKDTYGADELMDYSCFFLKENPELKNILLEYDLTNMDTLNSITDEMREKMEGDDQKRGELTYTLMTISGSLRITEKLDNDDMLSE